jgi:outer membrane protein OmpA-like peptidoglycan-associated protein
LAGVFSVNVNRVKNNPFVGEDDGPTYNYELAWDTTVKGIAYGVNVGYRKRDPGAQLAGVPVEPFKDQFIASAAMSYLLEKYDLKLIGEVFAGFPVKKPNTTTDRNLSSMELLVGVKKDIRHDIALHAGAGTEVYHGSSSPDWRIYTGINWNFGPVWHRSEAGEPKRLEDDNTEYFASKDIQPVEKFVAGDVLFAFDSSALTPQFENALSQLAAYLTRTKYQTLVVEGHTDSVGAEAYNQSLSERRANSVVKYLIENAKLDSKMVKGVGYGESKPIADNTNYQGRKKNRRVEFNITR